jgi:hypothetical protein
LRLKTASAWVYVTACQLPTRLREHTSYCIHGFDEWLISSTHKLMNMASIKVCAYYAAQSRQGARQQTQDRHLSKSTGTAANNKQSPPLVTHTTGPAKILPPLVLKHPTCAPLVQYHTCERGHVVFTGVFASCSALSVRPALGTKLTGNPRGPGCQRRRQRLAPTPLLSLSVLQQRSSLPVSLPHLYSCSPRMYVSVDPCLSSHTARRVRRQAC